MDNELQHLLNEYFEPTAEKLDINDMIGPYNDLLIYRNSLITRPATKSKKHIHQAF